jgi:ESCRT-I complex subunit VPS28
MYTTHNGAMSGPYAPTPLGYVPTGSLRATVNLDVEIKLAESAADRDLIDSLAEIYSIIRTIDGLEKAYIKDALAEDEYSEMCLKLIRQYQFILNDEKVAQEFGDLETFMRDWDVC